MRDTTVTTFTTKLGKTRAGEHSRIWIEGKRLAAAGFVCGVKFEKDFDPMQQTLWLYAATEAQFREGPRHLYGTVSGKSGKPIIDIVGAQVMETFRSCSHVDVAYELDRIVITARREG